MLIYRKNGLCEKCERIIEDTFIYNNHMYCLKHLKEILNKNGDKKTLLALELWELKEMKKKVLEKEKKILEMLRG